MAIRTQHSGAGLDSAEADGHSSLKCGVGVLALLAWLTFASATLTFTAAAQRAKSISRCSRSDLLFPTRLLCGVRF